MAEVDNLLEKMTDPMTINSCQIEGQMFLIFVRISGISQFFQSVHLVSYVASRGVLKGASN